MKITIYGTGCPKCIQAENVAKQAVAQAGVEAEIEHVKDIAEIAKAGVLMTPGVAIDGKIVSKGKVPDVAELVSAIMTAQEGQ
ncbi:MAG: thioredoxin family protein [Candidatus Zipacnadales bacterium]